VPTLLLTGLCRSVGSPNTFISEDIDYINYPNTF
jgi:hypothetical protein